MKHLSNIGYHTLSGGLSIIGALSTTSTVRRRGVFGGIYVNDGSTAQTIPTGATYTKLSAFTTNDGASNMTADATNDKITITIPANYLINCTISFSGTAISDWKMATFYNGVEVPHIHCSRKLGAGGDVGSASMTGILSAGTVGDVDIRVRHSAVGDQDITVQYGNLTLTYVGDL